MRILVIGLSGSGKTTLAARLAAGLQAPHVELDALYWGPDWTPAPREAFRARVAAATAGDHWVVDGYYASHLETWLWPRATHLLWLDYGRATIMRRVIGRSLARALSQRPLWNGNRERWRSWASPTHPIRWAWSQWRPRRLALSARLAAGDFAHLTVLRLREPGEAEAALRRLAGAEGQGSGAESIA